MSTSRTQPRVGITLGDCSGIGPEIVELALKSGRVPDSTLNAAAIDVRNQ